MDILCLSVYFEDGGNLEIYLLCKVSSIKILVSMASPAIQTTGNMIDLKKMVKISSISLIAVKTAV